MKTIKGPGIFLAQFMGDQPPFNNLSSICKWAASLGFVGVQIPSWDPRCIDLQKAAESQTYADEIRGIVEEAGLQITELSTHLQGQLVAVHPAYDAQFDGFAPENVRGNSKARTEWAVQQLKYAAKASANLRLNAHATFSGALLWHTVYPWPQRPAGLVETGFTELANRWLPILNVFDEHGVDLCYEIHPGEDLHDGVSLTTTERSRALARVAESVLNFLATGVPQHNSSQVVNLSALQTAQNIHSSAQPRAYSTPDPIHLPL
jgi:sugar phosphate isomerase/epimerase